MNSLIDGITNSYKLINQIELNGDNFATPGYWVALAARIFQNKNLITHNQLDKLKLTTKQLSYLDTMGFFSAVWGVEQQNHNTNHGMNYTKLACLDDADRTDDSNSTICNCIRGFAPNQLSGIDELVRVVGELHDNVWSHGMCTGFSMAQRWRFNDDNYIEFALADCGIGLLRELQRVNYPGITTDAEAIAWCIQQGNTTKGPKDDDDGWGQQLPPDAIGNPMGKGIAKFHNGNHHQGLGLAHLMQLVNDYNGTLQLATGDALLKVEGGRTEYIELDYPWQGVAISCRLELSQLEKNIPIENNSELTEIINLLTNK